MQWVCGTSGVLYVPSTMVLHLDGPPIHAALPQATKRPSSLHQAGQTAPWMPTCVSCLTCKMNAGQ